MTDDEAQEAVVRLLSRKHEIDATPTGQFVATHRWLIDSVELLLRMNLKDKETQK
jgi:hypothetical protein